MQFEQEEGVAEPVSRVIGRRVHVTWTPGHHYGFFLPLLLFLLFMSREEGKQTVNKNIHTVLKR